MSAFKQENGSRDAASAQAASAEAHDKARSARKRTKTGCLTCRKRRIKCDEGKPVCKNCQKSKRQCEGYNQRVVFKPADFQYLPHGGATITFDAGITDAHGDNTTTNHSAAFSQHPGPHPRSLSVASQLSQQYHDSLDHRQSSPHAVFDSTLHGLQQPTSHFQQSPELIGTPFGDHRPSFSHMQPTDSQPPNPSLFQSLSGPDASPFLDQYPTASWQQPKSNQFTPVLWSNAFVPNDQIPVEATQQWPGRTPDSVNLSERTTPVQQPQALFAYEASPEEMRSTSQQFPPPAVSEPMDSITLQMQLGRTGVLDEAAIEVHDEDYYDVDTEDEMYDMDVEFGAQNIRGHRGHRPYHPQNGLSASKLDVRHFNSFVFNGVMDTYRPEHVANPLKNPATARVFAHFISETAPILTTSPRQIWRVNQSNKSSPMSRNCIWTYTLPMAALHHQGLLQSMLAISSLQIAKIQGASETPSLKHYAYALKRIHHCVGNPKKRLSVPVLAASLLLGYYEIMAANHANWQSHLTGARHLVVETDFAGMTKMFKQLKFEKARQAPQIPRFSATGIPQVGLDQPPRDLLLDQMLEADENIVGIMGGTGVSYASYGHVGESLPSPQPLDLEKYDTLRDLYWWFCKQDVWHSLISSDPLMMDYSRYTDCPPRAPLGRADAPYGSFDHLVLLLARIADFASRDRKRKLKVEKMNAGSPQTGGRRTSSASLYRQSSATPPQNLFGNNRASHSPASSASHSYDSIDMNVASANALQEWTSIREALDFFAASLGPYFQPLNVEHQTPVETPFGPAVFYRTWDLNVFWTVYNMAMIAIIRNHPHMPPAAHVAAAAAIEQTREYALSIGRIAASIIPPPEGQPLDPRMGAAMVDMIIPQFFAGIQFVDSSHRSWLVERLFETNRRTGWATASIIAEGCQSGWIRAAEAGRGPAHVRVRKATFSDFRIGRYGDHLEQGTQGRVSELDAENDRKFVRTKASARVHWAIGLMGTEEDVPEESD